MKIPKVPLLAMFIATLTYTYIFELFGFRTKDFTAVPIDNTRHLMNNTTSNSNGKQVVTDIVSRKGQMQWGDGDHSNHDKRPNNVLPSNISDKQYNFTYTDQMRSWLGDVATVPSTLYTDVLLQPARLCPADVPLDYLVVVKSAATHWSLRQAIRNTFGSANIFGHLNHRLVFLLGRAVRPRHSRKISEESSVYNDIMQGDFLDSYHNLTLKGVMGLRWVNSFCRKTKVLIKTDDDTFTNIFGVVHRWIPDFSKRYRSIKCITFDANVKPIKRGGGNWTKWAVDDDLFPGLDVFPFVHCNGGFVLITGDLVAPMLAAVKVTPFFWIDDVYMYGLLTTTIGDVTHEQFEPPEERIKMTYRVEEFKDCVASKGVLGCNILWVNQNSLNQTHFEKLWSLLTQTLNSSQKQILGLSIN